MFKPLPFSTNAKESGSSVVVNQTIWVLPMNIKPELFIPEAKKLISQIYSVDGEIKSAHTTLWDSNEIICQFMFAAPVSKQDSIKEKILKAEYGALEKKLFAEAKKSEKTAINTVEDKKQHEEIPYIFSSVPPMPESRHCVIIAARACHNNVLEKHRVEMACFDLLKLYGIAECGTAVFSSSQTVFVAIVERLVEVEKLVSRLSGRFTNAVFSVKVAYDQYIRAKDLADEVAAGIKSFPTNKLEEKLTETVNRLWGKNTYMSLRKAA